MAVGRHSNWSKKERFAGSDKMTAYIDPGKYQSVYNPVSNAKTLPLSVFKSKTPKTFFEDLIQKEEKLYKSRNPEEEEEPSDEVVKF